jgi:hypothetical protein
VRENRIHPDHQLGVTSQRLPKRGPAGGRPDPRCADGVGRRHSRSSAARRSVISPVPSGELRPQLGSAASSAAARVSPSPAAPGSPLRRRWAGPPRLALPEAVAPTPDVRAVLALECKSSTETTISGPAVSAPGEYARRSRMRCRRRAPAPSSARHLASAACRIRSGSVERLHVELPPGVDLADPQLAGDTHAAVLRVERSGR